MPGNSNMIEVAKATVTIVPNMQGSQQTITAELTGVASTAGEKAGNAAGASMGKSIGKAVAGTAIAKKIGTGIAESWKEVDSALDTVAIKTGATGEELERLGDSMRRVATDIPTDFEMAGDAIGEVNTKFGLTGVQLELLSEQFVKFAQMNETDVSNSVETVANTLSAFGESGSHASAVLDAMNAAGQATGIGMDELGKALQKNAASFVQMGMSVEDAAGLMAAFNAAGLTTADTSIALRTALKNATNQGLTMNEAIAEFGKTMKSNKSDTEKLSEAIGLFGAKAGPALFNAFKNGKISAEDFKKAVTDTMGNVSETFEATLDPTDRFQQAMNGLKIVGAELVEAMAPAFNAIADIAVPMIQTLAEAFVMIPDGAKTTIVAVAGITAAAGGIIAIGGNLVKAFSGLGGALGSIGGAASSAAGGLTTIGTSAASAAGGAASAASGFGALAGGALQIVALGAGFALVGVGLKQIAQGAAMVGEGGLPAAAALLEMVAAVTAFMGVAALLGPALTAGAFGIGVFGAAILAIGAGIALATTGCAKLADAIGGMMEKTKAAGEGLNLIVDAIQRLTGMNLLDIGASMTAVGKGIKDVAKNSEEIATTGASMTMLVASLTQAGMAFAAYQQAAVSAMTAAKNAVTQNLDQMQQAFASTKFEFGNIKLPHFSMSGAFDAESGSVPTVNVDWYAKAAEKGALFTSPQLIGVGDSSQPEMLIGEQTLYGSIAQAVSENGGGGDVYVYIGGEQLDAVIQRSLKRTTLRSGGH